MTTATIDGMSFVIVLVPARLNAVVVMCQILDAFVVNDAADHEIIDAVAAVEVTGDGFGCA
jgi:hypothetical protein